MLVLPVALGVSADADLWWHVLAGREAWIASALPATDAWSYTATGAPWINHEWLPDLGLAFAFDHFGELGLLALRLPWLLLLLGAWLSLCFKRLPQPTLVWLIVGASWPMVGLMCNLRPHTATWALVPVALWVVDRAAEGRRWAGPLAVALAWLWANTHGGFLFGWGLLGLGLGLVALGVEAGPQAKQQRLLCLASALGVAVAPSLNPYGLSLWRYVFAELGAAHPDLPEWQPPGTGMSLILLVFGLMPFVVWLLSRARLRPTAWVGLLIAFTAAWQHSKFVTLVLLLSAPCLAEAAAPLWDRARIASKDLQQALDGALLKATALTVLLALTAALHAPTLGGVFVDPARYPVGAVRALAAEPAPAEARLLLPLGWGGLALYHLRPTWTVSMDGRNTTVYPISLVNDDNEAWRTGDAAFFTQGAPTAAIVPASSPMRAALLAQPGWYERYSDPTAALLLRTPGPDLGPQPQPLRFP